MHFNFLAVFAEYFFSALTLLVGTFDLQKPSLSYILCRVCLIVSYGLLPRHSHLLSV